MIYAIATIISITILSILIVWKSVKKSNNIVASVRNNISNLQQINELKTSDEQLLSELRVKFLEAQKNGIDRIAYINELKNELEKNINKQGNDDEKELFT